MSAPVAASGGLGLSRSMPTSIDVEHLFDMRVELAAPRLVASPAGTQMMFVAEGGVFAGERIRGRVLPGGGEWLHVGSDRVGRIDVRVTLQTHDEALVAMTNTGVIALGEDGLARFAAGEVVPWDVGYARSAPLFETGAEAYAWLNLVVTVAINELGPGYVNYRVLAVR